MSDIKNEIIEKNDNDINEKEQLAVVKQNSYAIQFIPNPSKKVQLAAVEENGCAIKLINNPSEAVQLAAVKQNGYVITYIHNPSEKIKLAAVEQNGYLIQQIPNPSEAVQLAAVKENGCAIRYINNPSKEVQLAAVKEVPYAIRYIKDPSIKTIQSIPKICRWMLLYVDFSKKTQLELIKHNFQYILFISSLCKEAEKLIVKASDDEIRCLLKESKVSINDSILKNLIKNKSHNLRTLILEPMMKAGCVNFVKFLDYFKFSEEEILKLISDSKYMRSSARIFGGNQTKQEQSIIRILKTQNITKNIITKLIECFPETFICKLKNKRTLTKELKERIIKIGGDDLRLLLEVV